MYSSVYFHPVNKSFPIINIIDAAPSHPILFKCIGVLGVILRLRYVINNIMLITCSFCVFLYGLINLM